MLRYVANNNNSRNANVDPSATNHGYNASDFLEDSSSFSNEDDNGDADNNDDVTLRAPLPNFHMLFQSATEPTTTTTATSVDCTVKNHRQEQGLLLLKNHDDYLRPFISALLVSCRVLRLSMETTYTAACLLHRFAIAHHSSTTTTTSRFKNQQTTQLHHEHQNDEHENNNNDDNDNDWRWIIASCILLACKAEEEPRRLRDLINMAHMITFQHNNNNDDDTIEENVSPRYHNTKQQLQQYQATSLSNDQPQDNNATSSSSSIVVPALLYWESEPPDLDTRYWQAKEILVKTEQNVLRWLAFDAIPSHPHRAVVVVLLSQQHSTQPDDMTQEIGSNKPEVIKIQQQQQRPLSSLPADAATGTLLMQKVNDNRHDKQEQKRSDLVHLAWTLLNNTVFYVEALRHDVIALATAALEMALEQQQQSQAPAASDDDDDVAKQDENISNNETDTVAARPLKKQKSENDSFFPKDENTNTNNIAVARARQSLQKAMTRVQRLSEMSTTTS